VPAVELPIDLPELRVETGGGQVARTLHPSGLRILSERMPGAASVTIGFWISAGSRDEAAGAYGSTHFLEHLLFKGTAGRSALDIAVAYDSVGGDHNAATAKEYTCYYARVRDRDLPMAVDVLADMIAASRIDPEEFELERGVILEELAMADDDPADVAGERFAEAVFGDHPLGRPIGGSPESIRAVDRDRVYAHYEAHYRPDELVVVAAGAVDHDWLVDALVTSLARYGWDLDASGAPRPRRDTGAVALVPATAVVAVDRPLEQVSVEIGMPADRLTSGERPVYAVMNAVLGGGMSSRLFQEVREKRGLAYGIYSSWHPYSDAGEFAVSASCTPGKLGELRRVVGAELDRIASEPIAEEERARVVGQLVGGSALGLESTSARMNRLARSELQLGRYLDLDSATAEIEAVTADQVQALAARLVAAPRVVVGVGPVTEEDLAR